MTSEKISAPAGGDTREQAARWFARMRGPDAETSRAEFEAWLARSPLQRDAYNRVAELFSLGKGLRITVRRAAPPPSMFARASQGWRAATLTGLVVLAGVGSWALPHSWRSARISGATATRRPDVPASASATYTTTVGEIRTVRLADGSVVTLDTNTVLRIAFGATGRNLRLERGRARFDVVHDGRTFVVGAGAGIVVAHGTSFDVRIRPGGSVTVRLLRGAVDVAIPAANGTADVRSRAVARLTPGQELVYTSKALTPPQTVVAPRDQRWPDATLDCQAMPLSEVVLEANRYSLTHIILSDASIGRLRMSGSFKINQPDQLADRLALLFDLSVEHSAAGHIVLSHSRTAEKYFPDLS